MVALQNTTHKFRYNVAKIRKTNKQRKLCKPVIYKYKIDGKHNTLKVVQEIKH